MNLQFVVRNLKAVSGWETKQLRNANKGKQRKDDAAWLARYDSGEIRDKVSSDGISMSKMVRTQGDGPTQAVYGTQQTCKMFRRLTEPTLTSR